MAFYEILRTQIKELKGLNETFEIQSKYEV